MKYLVVLLMVAGCASRPTPQYYWHKAGATQRELSIEGAQCQSNAYSVPFAPVQQQLHVYMTCMIGKGWQFLER